VEVLAGKQIGLALFQPSGSRERLAFRTMSVAAGVVRVPFVTTLITSLKVTPESRSATGFNGAQHAFVCAGQRGSMRLAKLLAMGAHDVGDFKGRPHGENQCGLGLAGRIVNAEEVQGTGDSANGAGRHPQVAGCGRETAVTQ
jgi:hypothetical protein